MSATTRRMRHSKNWKFWREPLPRGPVYKGQNPPARVNLRRVIWHHSPDGWEWGYGGSGPADLALAIVAYCLPVGCDGGIPEKLFHGGCSQVAWMLHQGFKWAFISNLPPRGGTLPGVRVDTWLDMMLAQLAAEHHFDSGFLCRPSYALKRRAAK